MALPDPGFDCADTIQGARSHDVGEAHGTPNFWIRYFSPSPYESFSEDPVTECQAAWDSGGPYIGVVSAPANIDDGSSGGASDAATMCQALSDTWNAVEQHVEPKSGMLWCFLDQEPNMPLGPNYWAGWASYVDGYEFPPGSGEYMLYPCLYLTPSSDDGCSSVYQSGIEPSGIWAAQHQACCPCYPHFSNTPSWNAEYCSGLETVLWQYNDYNVCNWPEVDLDLGHSGVNYADYCLGLSSRP